jgi:hypothetical protein
VAPLLAVVIIVYLWVAPPAACRAQPASTRYQAKVHGTGCTVYSNRDTASLMATRGPRQTGPRQRNQHVKHARHHSWWDACATHAGGATCRLPTPAHAQRTTVRI